MSMSGFLVLICDSYSGDPLGTNMVLAMACLVVYGIIKFLSHLSRLFGYVYGTFGSSQYCWVTSQ